MLSRICAQLVRIRKRELHGLRGDPLVPRSRASPRVGAGGAGGERAAGGIRAEITRLLNRQTLMKM